jgi:hypothetical protein
MLSRESKTHINNIEPDTRELHHRRPMFHLPPSLLTINHIEHIRFYLSSIRPPFEAWSTCCRGTPDLVFFLALCKHPPVICFIWSLINWNCLSIRLSIPPSMGCHLAQMLVTWINTHTVHPVFAGIKVLLFRRQASSRINL